MKIYFCDLCNESIPQEDLEKNQVTTVRGKMICARCVPIATAAAATAAAPGSKGGSLLGLVALLIAAAGAWLGWDARNRLDHAPDPTARLEAVEQSYARIVTQLGTLADGAKTNAAALDRIATEPAALRDLLADHLRRIEDGERSLQEVKTQLAWLSSARDVIAKLEIRQGRNDDDLGAVKKTLQTLSEQVAELGSAGPAAPAAAPAAAAPADAPKFDEETTRLVADLTNKDSTTRWKAVDRLAKKRDPALVPHLLPLLDDSDAFVQLGVINALLELKARSAAGRLIKLLRDGDAIVRGEALDALITLTGNAQRFEVADGTPAEREKGVKLWEEWYEKNKDRFADPSSS